MFIYSYQQHDHLLPGNDRMLVIGSSALAKNHGHLKSSRLAADTLIFKNENRQIIFHAGKNGYPPQKSRPRHLKTSDAPFFK